MSEHHAPAFMPPLGTNERAGNADQSAVSPTIVCLGNHRHIGVNLVVDPYDDGTPDPIYPPPRPPVVGDKIGGISGGSDRRCHGVYPIVEIEGNRLYVGGGTSPLMRVVYDANQWGVQWLFEDDPRLKFYTALDYQLANIRFVRSALAQGKTFKVFDDPVPPCENCGGWPCREKDGCPDYLALALGATQAKQVRAERAIRRAEKTTMAEAMSESLRGMINKGDVSPTKSRRKKKP